MPVLGADPDIEQEAWEEPVAIPRRTPFAPAIRELVDYFSYHRNMKMSQRNNEQDRAILGRYFAKKLSLGLTADSLKTMVDRFYQSWGGEHNLPALTFVSSKMQDSLLESAVVVKDNDEVLSWMLAGMPDDGPFDDSRAIRKAVLLHAGDLSQRYPELLAQVLGAKLDYEGTADMLTYLNDLVRWNLGDESISLDTEAPSYQYLRRFLDIPDELLARARSPKSVRRPFPTIEQAAASVPRTKPVKWKWYEPS